MRWRIRFKTPERQKNPAGSPTRVLTVSHRWGIMKKLQAPPVGWRRRPRQGSSSERGPAGVLTKRVRNRGGGGGGRAREAGRGGGGFRVLAGGLGVDRGSTRGFAGFGFTRFWCFFPVRRPGVGGRTDRGCLSLFRRRAQRLVARAHRAAHPTVCLRRGAFPGTYPRTHFRGPAGWEGRRRRPPGQRGRRGWQDFLCGRQKYRCFSCIAPDDAVV